MQIIASHFTFFEGMRKLGEDQGHSIDNFIEYTAKTTG